MGWGSWGRISGPPGGIAGRPAILSRNRDALSIFARDAVGSLWQLGCSAGRWHGWSRHDAIVLAGAPAAAPGPDHELVVGGGTDRAPHSTGGHPRGGWSGWETLRGDQTRLDRGPGPTLPATPGG